MIEFYTTLLSLNFQQWCYLIKSESQKRVSIYYMHVSFNIICGNCLYSTWLSMKFPIHHNDIITESCGHYFRSNMNSAWNSFEPDIKIYPVYFLFFHNFSSIFLYLFYLQHILILMINSIIFSTFSPHIFSLESFLASKLFHQSLDISPLCSDLSILNTPPWL